MGTECHYFVCDVANREEVYKQAKVVREKVCPIISYPEEFLNKISSNWLALITSNNPSALLPSTPIAWIEITPRMNVWVR